jgi:hypothetical protein
MLSNWLIDATGHSTALAVYLVLMAGIAFIAILLISDRSREPLR